MKIFFCLTICILVSEVNHATTNADFRNRLNNVYEQTHDSYSTTEVALSLMAAGGLELVHRSLPKKDLAQIESMSKTLVHLNEMETKEDIQKKIDEIRINANNYDQIINDAKGSGRRVRLKLNPQIASGVRRLQENAIAFRDIPNISKTAREALELSTHEKIKDLVTDMRNYTDPGGQVRGDFKVVDTRLAPRPSHEIVLLQNRQTGSISAASKAIKIQLFTKKFNTVVKRSSFGAFSRISVRGSQVFIVGIGAGLFGRDVFKRLLVINSDGDHTNSIAYECATTDCQNQFDSVLMAKPSLQTNQ